MKRRFAGFGLVWIALFAFAGCGGGEKVGEAFKEFEGKDGGERIGEIKQTPSPNPAGVKATPSAKTPPPAGAQATPQQQEAIVVRITSAGFDPTAARVFQGSSVKVTNTDSKPHTYTSSDGTYDSGSLLPGQSKTFAAGTPGNFQMEDRTRNWIIGSLEVIGR